MKRLAAIAFLVGASALAISACSNEPAVKLVGAQVDNFLLVDQTGMAHSLKYDTHTPAVVLVSQVNGDAGSRTAAKAVQALAGKHPDIVFKMINSKDGRDAIATEAKDQGITVPILDDDFQLVGSSLGQVTDKDGKRSIVGFSYAGEAMVIDPKTWKVAYHGPVDGVEAAITEVAAGKPVTKAEVGGS